MILLLGTLLLAFSVSIGLTPMVRKLAFNVNACAVPNHRTIHESVMPKLGGVAIFAAFLVGLGMVFLFTDQSFQPLKREAIVFLVASMLILLLGIYDDIKGANAYEKFSIQILASILVIAFGYKVESVVNPFGAPISLGVFSVPFTILWIVGISNAVNLIDGLDGLAAGIGLGASLIMLGISLYFGNIMSAFPAAILAGSIAGFLFYNYNPAKIFLGDSGSLLIGFLLACFSINGTFRSDSAVAIYIPMVVLGIPIVDTLLAMLRRLRKGIHLFQADREHIHHRLLQMGLSHRQAVMALHGVSLFWGLVGFGMMLFDYHYSIFLLTIVLLSIFFGLRRLGFGKYFVMKAVRRS